MYSCILCPLAPQQLAGWICKLVAAEDDWSINRWNLMLIKMNAFNVAWQWFAWIFKLPEDLLLGIPWLRLYLLQKQYKWRGPVVSEVGYSFVCEYHLRFFCIKCYSKEAVKMWNAMISENKALQSKFTVSSEICIFGDLFRYYFSGEDKF